MSTDSATTETCTVSIVGGGTSGLALAAELMRLKVGKVVVLEREPEAGGIPRHCGHYPFGLREYGRLFKGPQYAKKNRETAENLGVEIRTSATVTALREGGTLEVRSNEGRTLLKADRVVLCTGVRESSRAQRFIGGDRTKGILSTGALQSLVYLKGLRPFGRPIIFGSELVSFSAIQTCAHLKMKPVAMVEEEERLRVRRFFAPYLLLNRMPLHTGVRNPRIVGRDRVERLHFTNRNGDETFIEADGVIVSGRFRPEAALVRASHLEVDPGTGGPVIDQFGRCSDPAYFAAGNILRPAETSVFCWDEGKETARRIADDLRQSASQTREYIEVKSVTREIGFVVPQRIDPSPPKGGMPNFYVGLTSEVNATMQAACAGRVVWTDKIKSKPIRRLQVPIADILRSKPSHSVTFKLVKK